MHADPSQRMQRLDALFSHVWMVRTFLKHCDESEDDEELQQIHRDLYDVMHALGPAYGADDVEKYLKQARKKRTKLVRAAQFFADIQPEVSQHMNFVMAARSLNAAVSEIDKLLSEETP